MESFKELLKLIGGFIALILLAKVIFCKYEFDEEPTLYEVLLILIFWF